MAVKMDSIMIALLFLSSLLITPSSSSDHKLVIVLMAQSYEGTIIQGVVNKWKLRLKDSLDTIPLVVTHEGQYSTDKEVKSIVPVLDKVYKQYSNSHWFMIIKRQTIINNIDSLFSILSQYKDPRSKAYYLGRGLQDESVTIIHHYLPPGLLMYPLECSGFVLSYQAMKHISANKHSFTPSFTIDPLFEFSLFLKYLRYPSLNELHTTPPPTHLNGILMTHVKEFCGGPGYRGNECVTLCSDQSEFCFPALHYSKVFFAIKTCQKYHKERIPVQLNTWTTPPYDIRIQYYSDVIDNEYRTLSVGVANTERGHCTKLLEIFRMVLKEGGAFEWVVVADDDTLLSVPRVLTYLACHDSSRPLIIGEVYGYSVLTQGLGYLYPTAGSSVLLSKLAVQKIIDSNITCPTHDYPDDMFLGTLIKRLQISLLDTPLLHQNQPQSYHRELLSLHKPLSFHRFSPHNPLDIYKQYLTDNSEGESSQKSEL